jgi:hypothetical protein
MSDFKNQMQSIIKKGNQQLEQQNFSNHELQNNINADVKHLVDQVFKQLASVFPAWQHAWKSQQAIDTAKKEWVKAFIENDVNTVEQLRCGFKKARASDSAFLPSVGKFVTWCKPSLEDFNLDDASLLAKKVIHYHHSSKGFGDAPRKTDGYDPFIVAIHKSLDWFSFRSLSEEKAEKKVEQVAINLLKNGYNPNAVQTMQEAPRLTTENQKDEFKRPSPEVVKQRIDEMRSKFKKADK